MSLAGILFWASVFLVTYTYILYPVAMWMLAHWLPQSATTEGPAPQSVSFVVAARAEGFRIAERAEELLVQLETADVTGEVIIVLDGPGTPRDVLDRMATNARIKVIELPENRGKAAAITEGANQAQCEILALADVRQQWQDDALQRLLENFRDPRVGAVSGDLVLRASHSVTDGVGLYWRYEKWLRRSESTFDSVAGVTGAICAVRRDLFRGVPVGTILDDIYWPLTVVMQGYRVRHDSSARAFDRLPENVGDEFRRKTRTLAGNFQLVTLLPAVLVPWKNRLWWQFISHKLLRLAVPWLLLAVLLTSGMISGPLYSTLFWGQIAAYSALALMMATGTAGWSRASAAAGSFAMLNVAAWVAFWVWASGRAGACWSDVRYPVTEAGPIGSQRSPSSSHRVVADDELRRTG